MFSRTIRSFALTALLFGLFTAAVSAAPSLVDQVNADTNLAPLAQSDASDTFFDDSIVHEIYLTFDPADYGTTGWYQTLYNSHANDATDPYFPASFTGDGVTIAKVGVRFKGNSSFSANGVKKSFKIDFDEYDEDNNALVFYDQKKLNLNNGFNDPTMLREKLFYDFASSFVASPRAVHTKVYVNGEYYGLYVAVEQVDKTFVQSRFGDDEDGNLYKGAASEDGDAQSDFGSDLTWLGTDPALYDDYYVLKTNETAYDYSQLVEFINVLNNTATGDLPAQLEPIFDVNAGLAGMALNNLFVNLDSYTGSAHNYYLYDRDDTGKIVHIPWDANESFGRFLMFTSQGENPLQLSPFWLPSNTQPGQGAQERPLMENLWSVADYSNDYLCYLDQMLDSGFDTTTMSSRITQLASLIRADLAADPNKLYSISQFDTNLTTNIQDGRNTIYGLTTFVQQRAAYLESALAGYTLDCTPAVTDLSGTLFVNEFMAENDTTLQDPNGTGFPDWFELYNAGTTAVDLQGFYLTDDLTNPTQHAITQSLTIPAKGFLLLYADNDTNQGANHVGFKLGASGEALALFNSDGSTLIDSYTFGAQTADISQGRCPDGGTTWTFSTSPTPGASNEPCGAAPVISGVSHSPTTPSASAVVTVTATITDDGTINAATLWYSVGGDYMAITLSDQGGNVFAATIPGQANGATVNYYIQVTDTETFSTLSPANAPTTSYSYVVGYQAPVLYINELLASNAAGLEDPDEAGTYPDWIELYNPGSASIDLGGLYLSDDLTDPTQFQIPAGVTIAGGGFILFYADGDTDQGNLHTNFKLSNGGESVTLFGADGITQIDAITFPAQTTDIAYGRQIDGTGEWAVMAQATPGASNVISSGSYDFYIYLPSVLNP